MNIPTSFRKVFMKIWTASNTAAKWAGFGACTGYAIVATVFFCLSIAVASCFEADDLGFILGSAAVCYGLPTVAVALAHLVLGLRKAYWEAKNQRE